MNSLLNPARNRHDSYRGHFRQDEYDAVARFHASHTELRPTPLRSLAGLAADLGLAQILIKDETARWGVEAFKIAGVRFAVEQLEPEAIRRGFVCATAGNHGRAVARAARDLGVPCTIFLPAARRDAAPVERATREARVAAMRADHADVVETNRSYEEAVRLAAEHGAHEGATVVSDTAWPGYEKIPRLIMAGYTRLFDEAEREWSRPPDVVLVQGGVGGLVCAAANWFAFRYGPARPFLIACEPESAACLLESGRAGHLVTLEASGSSRPGAETFMAGLRCATPSPAAWPSIQEGIDAFVGIPDTFALEAMDRLRRPPSSDPVIEAGPSGGCGVGALLALIQDARLESIRTAAAIGLSTRVMAIVTEGR